MSFLHHSRRRATRCLDRYTCVMLRRQLCCCCQLCCPATAAARPRLLPWGTASETSYGRGRGSGSGAGSGVGIDAPSVGSQSQSSSIHSLAPAYSQPPWPSARASRCRPPSPGSWPTSRRHNTDSKENCFLSLETPATRRRGVRVT